VITDESLAKLVLGLDKTTTARKLVRLLIADPLGAAEPWEEQLEQVADNDGGGLLIR
jgi:hypothetical protein